MSYSRHTVNEEDLQTEADDTNFKMHMQVRRMVSDQRNQVRKRRKTVENNNGVSVSGVAVSQFFKSFPIVRSTKLF